MSRRSLAAIALGAGLLLGAPRSHADVLLVTEFNPTANDVLQVDTSTNGRSVFANTHLGNPLGIDVGNGGDVYVVNNVGSGPLLDTVSQFDSNGTFIRTFGNTVLLDPQGLTTDKSGNVYVANAVDFPGPDTVEKFSPSGTPQGSFVTQAQDPNLGISNNPYAVLFDKNTSPLDPNVGRFFKADFAINTVFVYNANGTLFQTITDALFNQPDGLAVDSNGNLYVSNFAANQILKFTPNVITGVYGSGTIFTTSNVSSPVGLLIGPSGNLFVANYANGARGTGYIEGYTLAGVDLVANRVTGLNGPAFLAAPAAVPEPASVTLLSTGLIVMIGYGWRRKRAAAAA